jgi:hypothetical protein
MKIFAGAILIVTLLLSCDQQIEQAKKTNTEQGGFSYHMPDEKPDREMSAALERIYTDYLAPRPEDNELFSQFKYTELKGFDYNGHDGTITRRDPSKIIFHNGKYYVWYTKRHTKVPPIGMRRAKEATDEIPSADWDLADIWYATSEDGFTWEEQGVAIKRPEKPIVGWRSVTHCWLAFGNHHGYFGVERQILSLLPGVYASQRHPR